jgi:alpha-galactosidase
VLVIAHLSDTHFGATPEAADRVRRVLDTLLAMDPRPDVLLHTGDVVRFDTASDGCLAHGVYATDRTSGMVSYVQLTTAPSLTPAPLRLPGLDPDLRYEVAHLPLPGERWGMAITQPAWMEGGVVLTGRQLAAHGIQPPILHPESAVLFTLTAV